MKDLLEWSLYKLVVFCVYVVKLACSMYCYTDHTTPQ